MTQHRLQHKVQTWKFVHLHLGKLKLRWNELHLNIAKAK